MNGEFLRWDNAVVHVNAVGHASVSSVFEGIRGYLSADGKYMNLVCPEAHYARLLMSAKIASLEINIGTDELIEATTELIHKCRLQNDIYIRPWAYISGVVREQISPQKMPTNMVIDSWLLPSRLSDPKSTKACLSSWIRIDDRSLPQNIKCFSNYHSSRLAAIEAINNGFDCPIFQNNEFKITESIGAGLGIVKNGCVIFPPIAGGVFNSITRKIVIDICRNNIGIPVEVKSLERFDLYAADEIFLVGTGWEISPISQIDSFELNRSNPITWSIITEYKEIVASNDENEFVHKIRL
jgi:branched-chain amino acid aminotransferase